MKESAMLVPLACGKHYGFGEPGRPCSKCTYFDEPEVARREATAVQYSGTPWLCVLVDHTPESVPTPTEEQLRIIAEMEAHYL